MAASPPRTDATPSHGGRTLARRWIISRLLPAIAVVVALLMLVPAALDWQDAKDARTAEPVGSATFREVTVPPYPDGVLELTGQFSQIDHAAGRAWFVVPFDFVDPIPADITAGVPVQVICRVHWDAGGVLTDSSLRVDVCRDIVRLDALSG